MSGAWPDRRLHPPRPSVPIVFAGAAVLWATCAMAYAAARTCDPGFCRSVAVTALVVGASCVGAAVFTKRAGFALAAMLAIGCALGMGRGFALHDIQGAFSDGVGAEAVVEMLEDSKAGTRGESALVALHFPRGGTVGAIAVFPDAEDMRYGERLVASVRVTAARIDRGDFEWNDGCSLRATVYHPVPCESPDPLKWLLQARAAAIGAFGDGTQEGALLQALVCGYRRTMSEMPLYGAFQTCGLAHMVAVSGAHLVIVTALFASVLKALRAPRRSSAAALVAVMCGYLVFSGAPVSALRATIMSSVGVLALFGRRRPSSLNALGVGMAAILAADPAASVSVSFSLSTLSTAGIVLFSPLVSGWLQSVPIIRHPLLAEPLALTLSASVLSQPLACALFCKLPLVSPVANIACGPMLPLACAFGLGSAACSLCGLPFSGVVGSAAHVAAAALGAVVQAIATVPYANVPAAIHPVCAVGLSVGAAVLLWVVWPAGGPCAIGSVGAVAAAALVAWFIFGGMPTGDCIVMFDVGQGDAFLLSSRGQTLLIDTGNQDKRLLAGLASNRIAHLDGVLVTHADDDHCGSLDALAQAVDVDRVIVAEGVMESDAPACVDLAAQSGAVARDVVEVAYGDCFDVGAFRAVVVWPHGPVDDADNADSICLLVAYDGNDDGLIDATALFTGDAESEQLSRIMGECDLADIDVLKVGHHGSRNGMTASQVGEIRPRIALIGVGRDNRYGHPAGEILNLLEGVGCAVYRSDEDGEVRCTLSPNSISMTAMK